MTLNLKMNERIYLINFLNDRKKFLDEIKFIDGLGVYEIRELKMITEVVEKLKRLGSYIIIFNE
ncbi:MAG: hypothetical protein WC564_03520 [Patescibacteria group bacterium]|jgi:hypothetical protein